MPSKQCSWINFPVQKLSPTPNPTHTMSLKSEVNKNGVEAVNLSVKSHWLIGILFQDHQGC